MTFIINVCDYCRKGERAVVSFYQLHNSFSKQSICRSCVERLLAAFIKYPNKRGTKELG